MSRGRRRDVEPRPKPRAGWAGAAKDLREGQDQERRERASRDATSEPLKEATYRCVDLDVRSRRSLAPLLAAWPNAQAPGRVDEAKAPRWVLLTGASVPRSRRAQTTADQGVTDLVEVIKGLPRAARRCWNEATYRTFDIAIDAAPGPNRSVGIPLGQRTIEAVQSVAGRILITVYPPEST